MAQRVRKFQCQACLAMFTVEPNEQFEGCKHCGSTRVQAIKESGIVKEVPGQTKVKRILNG